jgi:hypothetical protein
LKIIFEKILIGGLHVGSGHYGRRAREYDLGKVLGIGKNC